MIYRTSLFGLPGFTTVGAAVFDSSYVPSIHDTSIGLLTGEITTGDASGYARITNIATTWNGGTFKLDIDDPGTHTFDLYGAPDVATLVFYDPSDGALISWVPITPHVGFDGWPIPVASVADIADTGTLGVQVANLDGRVTVLENSPAAMPDPSGEDDGDVLTVASGEAVWAPPAGGAPDTTGADPGDVLTVDSPGSPAVWSPPAGGGSPPPTPTAWETTASYYVHDGRVWLGGIVQGSGGGPDAPLGTLPPGARPASVRVMPATATNDAEGITEEMVPIVVIAFDNGGVMAQRAGGTFVGDVGVGLDGLSFRIEDPA